jgi:hypothetical protein
VESKWKNYHITTFPGQSLSKTLEEAMDLSQDRLILELEMHIVTLSARTARTTGGGNVSQQPSTYEMTQHKKHSYLLRKLQALREKGAGSRIFALFFSAIFILKHVLLP